MELIHILGKQHVREILTTLHKHGPLHIGQLIRLSGCPGGTITRRIKDLEKAGLVKTYEKEDKYRLPLRVCEITDLGRKALKVYRICDEISKTGKASPSPEDPRVM